MARGGVSAGRQRPGHGRSRGSVQRPAGWRDSTHPAAGAVQGQVSQIQRARLLAGAVAAIDEYGYGQTTVAHITARARVSRRTFYELFENRDRCFAALLRDVAARVEQELAAAGLQQLSWTRRVRGGLAVILAFLDREPVLARVCVVQALRGGPAVLEQRELVLRRLAEIVAEGRRRRSGSVEGEAAAELVAEGLVGATFAIVHGRVARGEAEPLIDLLGELSALIVLPYLGTAAARRERLRPVEPPLPAAVPLQPELSAAGAHDDPLAGLSMRLTYRTTRVLGCAARQPGVSNRLLSEHAGIVDQGQMSKLLARLQKLGLLENSGGGHAKGEANAWRLTPLGAEVTRRLQSHVPLTGEAVA